MITIPITLNEIQELMREYYYKRDSERGLHATFTWLVEEVGELAEAILNNDRKDLEEEVADVLAWLASIANLSGISLEKAFKEKYLGTRSP